MYAKKHRKNAHVFFLRREGSVYLRAFRSYCYRLDCVWNVMSHAQNPDFVFRRKGRVHLNRGWGSSVQSTSGSRGVLISGSNVGYTMFRGSVKSTGYSLHSPFFPSLVLPCVSVCHHVSTGLYPSVRFGVSTGYRCRRLPDGQVVAVFQTDNRPVRFTIESQTRTPYPTLLSARAKKKKNKSSDIDGTDGVRPLDVNGRQQKDSAQKEVGLECSRVWCVRVIFYSLFFFLRRLVRAVLHGFIAVTHRTLDKQRPAGSDTRSDRAGLANIFDRPFSNCLQISKKFFRVPVGILKSKTRYWSIPKLLLITVLSLLMYINSVLINQCSMNVILYF